MQEVQYFGAFTRFMVDVGGSVLQADLAARRCRAASPASAANLHWDARAVHAAGGVGMSSAATLPAAAPPLRRRVSDLLYTRRGVLLLALLAPPLLWLGMIYLGSLLALLANAFFGLDEFTGLVVREFTLSNFVELTQPANLDVILRTVTMAIAVTLACAVIGFPVAYYMARHASGATKAMLYIAVMLPLWSSYLVRVYAWKLLLAKEGAINWVFAQTHAHWLLDALLSMPLIGGPSLRFSTLGTFIVFVYIWLPFMILPIQAAIERIPGSYIEASGDLGAGAGPLSPRSSCRWRCRASSRVRSSPSR